MSIKVSTTIIIIIIIIIIKAISPSHATEPKSFMIMIMMIIIITLTLIYPPKCNNYYFLHPIANLDHCSEEANNTENKLNPSLWKAQTEQNHLQYFWLHCTNLQPNFHIKKGSKIIPLQVRTYIRDYSPIGHNQNLLRASFIQITPALYSSYSTSCNPTYLISIQLNINY